jgi:hypothetical protein
VRELEDENCNLRLKIRALEMLQARPPSKEEDARQQHLDVQHTESVKVEQDPASESAPTIPSSSTKRKPKKRLNIEDKLKDLPVLKKTVLIPHEVKDHPELWEEIGEIVTREVIVKPTTLGAHEIVRKKYRFKIDRSAAPIIAKAPIRFSSSYVSTSLAIYIALSKYLEHNPSTAWRKSSCGLGSRSAGKAKATSSNKWPCGWSHFTSGLTDALKKAPTFRSTKLLSNISTEGSPASGKATSGRPTRRDTAWCSNGSTTAATKTWVS